jgi:hypothetical protein
MSEYGLRLSTRHRKSGVLHQCDGQEFGAIPFARRPVRRRLRWERLDFVAQLRIAEPARGKLLGAALWFERCCSIFDATGVEADEHQGECAAGRDTRDPASLSDRLTAALPRFPLIGSIAHSRYFSRRGGSLLIEKNFSWLGATPGPRTKQDILLANDNTRSDGEVKGRGRSSGWISPKFMAQS